MDRTDILRGLEPRADDPTEKDMKAMLLRAGLCTSCADNTPDGSDGLCGPCRRGTLEVVDG
jgi:hypothetical protein